MSWLGERNCPLSVFTCGLFCCNHGITACVLLTGSVVCVSCAVGGYVVVIGFDLWTFRKACLCIGTISMANLWFIWWGPGFNLVSSMAWGFGVRSHGSWFLGFSVSGFPSLWGFSVFGFSVFWFLVFGFSVCWCLCVWFSLFFGFSVVGFSVF